jgi:TRAP-type uncharacterized transport system fused permease subunit
VERFSPGLSAFWATVFMVVIVLTHKPIKAMFRAQGAFGQGVKEGFCDLLDGLVTGSRNMIGIGVATAAAGIVVGTVTLTGIGLVMTEFVEFISAGNIMLMLLFTAVISLLLGMGLPTTANYIVVSTLMAPVIVTLGAQQGLIVPLIAVHLFVFYFGILADDTPPVGLAAFAAAAIARSDPIRTGVQGFTYDIRTAVLPFMFIFNTELLLMGTQGYWLVKSRWYETLLLLLIAFTLFRPGFWWDEVYPPVINEPAQKIEWLAEQVPANGHLMIQARGMTIDGDEVTRLIRLPLEEGSSGAERLENAGLVLNINDDSVIVDLVAFGSAAQDAGFDFDWEILSIQVEADRPDKQWMYLPALLLLAALAWLQIRRRRASAPETQEA